jgi:hypothetical protein
MIVRCPWSAAPGGLASLTARAGGLLWLLGQRGESGNRVTEEEVHMSCLAEAHEGGVLEPKSAR